MVKRIQGPAQSIPQRLDAEFSARPQPKQKAPEPRPPQKVLGGARRAGGPLLGLAPMIATHELRLRNGGGEVRVPADNYFLDAKGALRPEMAKIAQVLLRRAPETQEALNLQITEAHAAHEMSFRVKDPETGNYDKIFKVPAYGTVVPLREAHFQKLVASTEPVMRALRQMLQVLYSNPDASAEELGLQKLPKEEQERVRSTIRDSLYFEPQLADPVMKDYPFLAVGGFDASVGNLENPEPIFFEYNLGTPSGLSNNLQLVDLIRERDPELYATFEKRLPKDETFAILKKGIESNAQAWTGKPNGISVVIGPGVYNGAHPDVASIAMFSGMPLVNPSDLYQDEKGEVRLNTGAGQRHPVVTGIYGRMEESYFLSDAQAGLPLRSPDYDNVALSQKFGVELKPGIIYALQYDAQGEVIGVAKDAAGQPKLQEVFESMGRDPNRPEVAPGGFLNAIKSKQLYYSGLGGRVVDDKRVFQSVSRYLAPDYTRTPDAPIARPPRTLDVAEYDELYQSKNLERFVVKAPDQSGGSGVHLMCNLTPAQRQEVLAEVRKAPGEYIVQEFAQPAVMSSVERNEQNEAVYGSLANDWRIFSVMDAEGKVSAGPSSLLLRAAKPFSASTNTSQGAGYGVGLVLADEEVSGKKSSLLPPERAVKHVGLSRRQDLAQFVDQLHKLITWTEPGMVLPKDGTASLLAQFQRDVMDLLGRKFAPLMSVARDYDLGAIDQPQLHARLLEFRSQLLEHPGLIEDLSRMIRRGLAPEAPPTIKAKKNNFDRAAARQLPFKPFREAVSVRTDAGLDGLFKKVELGRYERVEDPSFQAAIDELKLSGGELRAIRIQTLEGELREDVASAYFRLSDDGVPLIGIDLAQSRALAGLAHEMEHFRLWRELRDSLLKEGLPPKEAAFRALAQTNTPEMRVLGEQRSLAAELKAEPKRSQLNQGAVGPRSVLDEGYLARQLYPELEGVRDHLHREKWSPSTFKAPALDQLLDQLVAEAQSLRQETFRRRRDQALVLERSPKESERLEGHRAHARAFAELNRSLFNLVVDDGAEARFATDQTWEALRDRFSAALARAGLNEDLAAAQAREHQIASQQQ